jgi:hypothetical protein
MFDQLKSAGPQKECDMQIPLNVGNTEALSGGLSLEPVVLSLTKEDSTFHPRNSFQPYNPEKQTLSGGKTDFCAIISSCLLESCSSIITKSKEIDMNCPNS